MFFTAVNFGKEEEVVDTSAFCDMMDDGEGGGMMMSDSDED